MQKIATFLLVCVLAAPAMAGPDTAPASASSAHANIAHIVLIWLKEPGNAEHRQRIIDTSQKLRAIPGVLDLQVGPVLPSDRAVAEDGYDVGLYVRLKDRQALQAYLEHPTHTGKLAEVFLPIMDRYKVFDFAVAPPAD